MNKLLLCGLIGLATTAHASINGDSFLKHHAYAGLLGGLGSTTWQGLVPSEENQNPAMSLSTPISVEEGGAVWGGVAGYEFSPFFALEANYTHYPDATIWFDLDSLFAYENDGRTSFTTHTQTISLMGKVMLVVPNTKLRFFSSAGAAGVNRWDDFFEKWQLAPTFGLGANAVLANRLMGELAFNYTAGYGEAEMNPAKDFIPFLYSVTLRVSYRFW